MKTFVELLLENPWRRVNNLQCIPSSRNVVAVFGNIYKLEKQNLLQQTGSCKKAIARKPLKWSHYNEAIAKKQLQSYVLFSSFQLFLIYI